MDQTQAAPDAGFTLIEIVVTVAIIATTVAAGVGVSLASRSFAVSAAAAEFDHLLDSARTIARETQGATIAFAPDAYGDGTEVRVLAPGPNGTLTPTTLPILHARASIDETEALGKPPYALVVHTGGALGGRPGYRTDDTATRAEVGCPANGAFHFVIRAAGGSADRFLPCRIMLAATGPVALATWPPATAAPAPTPCGGPCMPAPLPTAPSSSPSCPPNYTATPGGCTPTPPPAFGARYHVAASLAAATMTVGGTDTLTAQATLTNPTTVPAGTPPSIPVQLQPPSGGICNATPPGPQPSGATFTLSALTPGTCTITIEGDTSAVPGATSDNATLNVPVTASPSATPSPPSCDLRTNGKCYHRIVEPTIQEFSKLVYPDSQCSDNGNTCWYIDSIKGIELGRSFGVQPPIPPVDLAHELLFQIDRIASVEYRCEPYSFFATLPVSGPIAWQGPDIAAPGNAPPGSGNPSLYFTVNHLVPSSSSSGSYTEPTNEWSTRTTFLDIFEAVARGAVGSVQTFTYSSPDTIGASYVDWYPDFTGCDVSGDPNNPPAKYGFAAVHLVFEVYQATPQQ